jgi:hypothetical protein
MGSAVVRIVSRSIRMERIRNLLVLGSIIEEDKLVVRMVELISSRIS